MDNPKVFYPRVLERPNVIPHSPSTSTPVSLDMVQNLPNIVADSAMIYTDFVSEELGDLVGHSNPKRGTSAGLE
jgi:hypothetical protein